MLPLEGADQGVDLVAEMAQQGSFVWILAGCQSAGRWGNNPDARLVKASRQVGEVY
jgi:hypothetical protein